MMVCRLVGEMMKNLGSLLRCRCNSALRLLASLSRQCLSSLRHLLVRLRHLAEIVLGWASANKEWIIPVAISLAEIVLMRVIGVAC